MGKGKYIFLQIQIPISELYDLIISELNISKSNTSGVLQHRWGENYGGEYYFIEAVGYEINIVQNRGESFIEEYSEYSYYLFITLLNEYLNEYLNEFVHIVTTLLKSKTTDIKVD